MMNAVNKDIADSIDIEEVRDRTLNAAHMLIDTPMTLQALSAATEVPLDTVHTDLLYRLPHINELLFREVEAIIADDADATEYMERRFKAQFDAVLKAREESGRDVNPGHRL